MIKILFICHSMICLFSRRKIRKGKEGYAV